jgi:hypothetical protein
MSFAVMQFSGRTFAASKEPAHEADSVLLSVKLIESKGERQTWECRYPWTGPSDAVFSLEIGERRSATDPQFSFAKGVLRAKGGKAPANFLHALAVALDAKANWPRRQKTPAVTIDVGILGDRLIRAPGQNRGRVVAGEFSNTESGQWLVTKLFLGESQAEVYLALNNLEGYGLLIRKDPEYGREAVAEFARLF